MALLATLALRLPGSLRCCCAVSLRLLGGVAPVGGFRPPASWARCRSPLPHFSACIGAEYIGVTRYARIADSQGYAGATWLGLWPALYFRPLRSALLAEYFGYLFGFPLDCTRIPLGLYFEATTLPGGGGYPPATARARSLRSPPRARARAKIITTGGGGCSRYAFEPTDAAVGAGAPLPRALPSGGAPTPRPPARLPLVAPAPWAGYGDSGCRGQAPSVFFGYARPALGKGRTCRLRRHCVRGGGGRRNPLRPAPIRSPGYGGRGGVAGRWPSGARRRGAPLSLPRSLCARRPAPRHFLPPLCACSPPSRPHASATRPLRPFSEGCPATHCRQHRSWCL